MTPFALLPRFPERLFRWKDKDKKELQPVQWESKWESDFVERRGRRKSDRRRLIPRDDFFVLLRHDRAGQKRTPEQCASCGKVFWEKKDYQQHGTELDSCPKERREPRDSSRYCEICRRTFHNRFELAAHLPCRAFSRMVSEGLADLIQNIKLSGHTPHSEQRQKLREILEASLSETVFERARERGEFRYNAESTWDKNFQRFRNDLFFQFVARIRPELVDAENPAPRQRDEVARIQGEFFRPDSRKQKNIIVELFARESLGKIAKREEPGRPASSSPFTENSDLRRILQDHEGQKAAKEVNKLKVVGLDAPTQGKPMHRFLKKWRDLLGARSRRRVKSTQ